MRKITMLLTVMLFSLAFADSVVIKNAAGSILKSYKNVDVVVDGNAIHFWDDNDYVSFYNYPVKIVKGNKDTSYIITRQSMNFVLEKQDE